MFKRLWETLVFHFIHKSPFYPDMKEWHWSFMTTHHRQVPPLDISSGDVVLATLQMTRGFGYYAHRERRAIRLKLRSWFPHPVPSQAVLSSEGGNYWAEVLTDTTGWPCAPKRGELVRVSAGAVTKTARASA